MDKIKILLVDDDLHYRNSLTTYLREVGYSIDGCKNSNEAIALLSKNNSDYRVVLLDWALKSEEESGQVMEKVKAVNPYLPVIVFTGNPREGSSVALQRGASWYLRKPFSPEDLESVIKNILAQDAISHQMAKFAKDIMGSDQVLIWRYHGKMREFRLAAWVEPMSIDEKEKGFTLKENDPKLRRVIRKTSPSFFNDLQHNSSHYHTRKYTKQTKWRLLISIPLEHKGEMLGLMEIYFGDESGLFPEQNQLEKRVQTLAGQAAESIYNAERAIKNQELINSISSLSAEQPSLDALADAILSKAHSLVESEAGIFFLRDFRKNSLLALGGEKQRLKANSKQIDISNNNLASNAAREGTIESVNGANVSEYVTPFPIGKYHSQVAIPLKRGDLVVGVLVLASKPPNAFPEGDIALMRAFVALVGSVIDQAKLRLHLQNISQAVLKEPESLQKAVVEAIHELLGKSVALWMWNEEKSEFVVPVALGVSEEFQEDARIPYVGSDNSLIAHAFLTKKPIILPDMENPPEGLKVMLGGLLQRENWRSTLIVPIIDSEDQPIGAIAIKRDVVGEFSQYEVDFLSNFASQVALAFENRRRRDKLAHLVKSGQIAIGEITNEQHVLQQFIELASQLTGAPCIVIYPYDPENETFYDVDRVAAYGRLDKKQKTVTHKPRKSGLAQIIRSTKLIVIHDLDKGEIAPIDLSVVPFKDRPFDKKTLFTKVIPSSNFISREQVKAFVGISLQATEVGTEQKKEQEVGVLYINYRTPHYFTQSEIDVIQLFAQQVANLIRAARLLERQRQQLNISQTLVEVSDMLTQAKDRDTVLRIAFRSAFAFVGKVTGFVLSVERNHRLRIVDSIGLTKTQVARFHKRPVFDYEGSFGEVIRTRKLFEADDTGKTLVKSRMVDFGLPIQNQLSNFPIVSGEKASGILVLDTYISNRKFKDALLSLVDNASTALGMVDANEERRRQLIALQSVIGAIGSLETDPLQIILEKAVDLLAADYGAIALVNQSTSSVEYKVLWEKGKIRLGSEIHASKRQQSLGVGIVGHVANSGELYYIPDVTKPNPYYVKWYNDSRSELAVPLLDVHRRIIGVLDLENTALDAFSAPQRELCRSLAQVAAEVVEKSNLFKTTQELNTQFEVLHDVVQEKDLSKALYRIAKGVNIAIGQETCTCSIAQFDEKGDQFIPPVIAVGPLADMLSIPPREKSGMGWYVLDNQNPLFVENVEKLPKGAPELNPALREAGIKSTIVLPLIRREHKLGVLFIHQRQISVFSSEIQRLLKTYAHQAAIAIDNARQYEQRGRHIAALQEAYEQLEILLSVVQEKDLNVNLQKIVLGINKVMGPETCTCSITLFDEKEDHFISTIVAVGPLAEKMQFAPREQGEEGIGWGRYVLDYDTTLFIEDTSQPPRGIPKVNPGLADAGVRSSVALPLTRNKHKLGALFVHQQKPALFSSELRNLLKTYAHHAAIAIENARQYEQRGKDIAALRDVNEAVAASKSLNEILNLIVKNAVEVMPAEYGILWMGDPLTGDLVLQVPPYCPSGEINPPPKRLKSDAPSVNMRVYRTGKSIIYDIDRKKKDYHRIYKPARSELAVPMKYKDQIIGTLNVESRYPAAFSEENALLLESFADQAAIAIESARIIERLEYANGVGRELMNRLWHKEEDIFRFIKGEAGKFMDTGNFYIALYQERSRKVSFPFAIVNGQQIDTNALDSPWGPRPFGKGLTEEVIHSQKPVLMKTKAEQDEWYKERGINYVNITFTSWLGVPLLHGEKVIGIIATYHQSMEYMYGEDDVQILSLLASQLASALKNMREMNTLQTLSHELLKLSASFWEQEAAMSTERSA